VSAAPNPSPDGFTIRFTAGGFEPIPVAVFDAAGRLVRMLDSDAVGGGRREARWDGRDEAGVECWSGLYFARVGPGTDGRSIPLLRVR
jgi:flagellar hook assembly protein FlgD